MATVLEVSVKLGLALAATWGIAACAASAPDETSGVGDAAPEGEEIGAASQAAGPYTCVNIRRGLGFAVEDTQIRADLPNKPGGGVARVTVSGSQSLTAAMLVHFDLTAIPHDAVINTAELGLTQDSNTGPATMQVHSLTSPFSEATMTWNIFNAGYNPVPDAIFSNGIFASHFVLVNVKPLLQQWLSGSIPNNGLIVRTAGAAHTKYFSSENASLSRQPRLYVCYSMLCAGVTCNAQDSCHTAGTCDPTTGLCSNPVLPNGSSCNDGNGCTQTDVCQAGVCVGSNPVTCGGADACNGAGVCNAATGTCSAPVPKANGTACNDGNACTQADTCQAGVCSGATTVVCHAGNVCNNPGTCNPATGTCSAATPKANGSACNDGNACTLVDTCQAGLCTGGSPLACPGDTCNAPGACNPATGACSPATPKVNGAACDDGNACTQTDTCQFGVCTGANPLTCAGDTCTSGGTCSPATGCSPGIPKPNGIACSDGNACTQTDTCLNGVCQGTNPIVCCGADACNDDGVCNPATGVCSAPVPKANGTACNDGNACTQTDTCQLGVCSGGNPVTCPGDGCHAAGECNAVTGACGPTTQKPDFSACDDGNGCTQIDVCMSGACTGMFPRACEPSDACHMAGTCSPATGACSDPPAADGSACEDGQVCTNGDTCVAGSCQPGLATCCSSADNGVCDASCPPSSDTNDCRTCGGQTAGNGASAAVSWAAKLTSGSAECAAVGRSCVSATILGVAVTCTMTTGLAHGGPAAGTASCGGLLGAGVAWAADRTSGDEACAVAGRTCVAAYFDGASASCSTTSQQVGSPSSGSALCGPCSGSGVGAGWQGAYTSGAAACAGVGRACVASYFGGLAAPCATATEQFGAGNILDGGALCGAVIGAGASWSLAYTSGDEACAAKGRSCSAAYLGGHAVPCDTGTLQYAGGVFLDGAALCDVAIGQGVAWTAASTSGEQACAVVGRSCAAAYFEGFKVPCTMAAEQFLGSASGVDGAALCGAVSGSGLSWTNESTSGDAECAGEGRLCLASYFEGYGAACSTTTAELGGAAYDDGGALCGDAVGHGVSWTAATSGTAACGGLGLTCFAAFASGGVVPCAQSVASGDALCQ